jgi:hypothetical protein
MDPHEQSDRDFSRARRRAFLRKVGAYLRRDPGSNQLLSFDEVKGALGAVSQVYVGLREVPVSQIVGSVGRHRDFDRAFLPSKPDLGTRWRRIDEIMDRGEELPPVSLYKIGDVYFVQDGNHRVSVALQRGVEMIDAEVIELRSRVPLDSALTARDLLHKLEHRHLLERLPFDRVLPEIKVQFSDVSDYRKIREERILDAFRDRTELDLYLWIVYHRERLALEARDEKISPQTAKDDILKGVPRRRRPR